MNINELTPAQIEALGLRFKKTAIYESDYQIIDEASGEIIRRESKTVSKVSEEPDFIKVYYKVMMAFADVQQIPIDFLIAMSEHITYTNQGSSMTFLNNKMIREDIQQRLEIKDGMYKRYLHRCCEQGVLIPKKGYRGAYDVNPWLIAKGRWESVKALQANFDFINGKWRRIIADPPEAVEVNQLNQLFGGSSNE